MLSTGTSNWPPTRRKSQKKSAAAMSPPKVAANGFKPLSPPASSTRGSSAAQGQVVVNATPSSSKNQLPPGNYKSIDEVITAPPTKSTLSSSFQSKTARNHTPASVQSAHGSAKRNPAPIKLPSIAKSAPQDKQGRKASIEPSKPSSGMGRKNPSQPIPASRSFPQSHDAKPREPSLHRRASEGNAGIHSDATDNVVDDVFTEQKMEQQPSKERHTHNLRKQLHAQQLVDAPVDTHIPHIDLKDVSANGSARSKRQSSISTASRVSSARASIAPSLSAPRRDSLVSLGSRRSSSAHAAAIRDMERFEKAGRQALLGQLAQRYGFDFAVAVKAYERLHDLDKTNAFLSKLRDEADAAGRALLDEMLDEDNKDDGGEKDEGGNAEQEVTVSKKVAKAEPEAALSISAAQQPDRSQRRRSSGPRHSLTIRPIPTEEVDKYALTVEEYSPPRRSRAGRYSRQSGGLLKPHIMPYSQTPGAVLGNGYGSSRSQDMSSPPRVDLRYSSSPLKGRKSMDQESLPPSSPPKEEGGDGQEDEGDAEENDLEQEYEDLFGDVHRPTSPEQVEQELFEEQLGEDEDEDEYEGELQDADEDEDGYEGEDRDEDDEDEHGDSNNDPAMDTDEGDDGHRGGHSPPAQTEDASGIDSDTNPAIENIEQYTNPKRIFATLHPAEQETQRQLARFADTTIEGNNEMREWEATLDPEKKEAHGVLLLQTVLQRMKDWPKKPVRLDRYFNEALEEYSK